MLPCSSVQMLFLDGVWYLVSVTQPIAAVDRHRSPGTAGAGTQRVHPFIKNHAVRQDILAFVKYMATNVTRIVRSIGYNTGAVALRKVLATSIW